MDVTGNNTEVRTIKVEGLYEYLTSGRMVLPRFQRTEVWDEKKKRELIESMRRRLPIGSLLVYETDQGRRIPSGLQRTIAIRDFMHAPHTFIKAESLKGQARDDLSVVLTKIAAIEGVAFDEGSVLNWLDRWIEKAGSLETDVWTPRRLCST